MNPIPAAARPLVRRYAPSADVRFVAGQIAERAWHGAGVHVYRWPDGTVVVSKVGTLGDSIMLKHCIAHFVGAWGHGAQQAHILELMRWLAGGEA